MKIIESIKFHHRANKCKKKDPGGIGYLITAIEKGQTVLDIGTHKGGYLYWMLQQVGNSGKVYAFEPQSELYRYIKKLKRLFKWHNVTIEHFALSDTEGEITLYIPTNKWRKSSPAATVIAHKTLSDIRTTETVNTETLDSYCNRHKIKPDLFKIDVEGKELKVLEGGKEILKKYKPKIFIEIEAQHIGHEKVLETFDFMKSLRYEGQFIHGSNQLPLSSFTFDEYQDIDNKEKYCNNFIFE